MLNLRRADDAARRAAEILGKRSMPAPYPHDPAEQAAAATRRRRGRAELDAICINTRDGTLALLRDAIRLQRAAENAQTAAVEALRHLGGHSLSWTDIGRELDLTAAGAHKRLRHVEAPLAQTSIDDLEPEPEP